MDDPFGGGSNNASQETSSQLESKYKRERIMYFFKAWAALYDNLRYRNNVPDISKDTTTNPGIPHIEGCLLPPPLPRLLSPHAEFSKLNSHHVLNRGLKTLPVADSDSSSYQSWKNNANKESQKSNKKLTIPAKAEGKSMNQRITGTPLAHVFSISINPDIKECKLYGKIWVEDHMGIVDYLFNLDREEATLVCRQSSDNSLLLYQTNRAILATDYFKVLFHLKSEDSDFLEESFCWYGKTDEDFDKLLSKTIVGKDGSATVSYIVHSVAVEGHIVPRFKKSETGSSSFRIKGTLIACYRNMQYDICPSDGAVEEYSRVKILDDIRVKVTDEQLFNLDRSVLAIPLYCPLAIEVDLYKDGGEGDGKVVWKETVEFSIRDIMNDVVHEIQGSNGSLSLGIYEINYAHRPFTELDDTRDMWRSHGIVTCRWTYGDPDCFDRSSSFDALEYFHAIFDGTD